MRAPDFWQKGGSALPRLLLSPFGLIWRAGASARRMTTKPVGANVPVICVGNLEMGGTGKTPAVRMLSLWFRGKGIRTGVLSRGYGGSLSGTAPVLVDPAVHGAQEVGDEPMLHVCDGPVVIAADRGEGAKMLSEHCDVILMDDGHQNPGLIKDLSLVVTRAAEAFGNGSVFPAGPLREPIAEGLARANAIIATGGGILDRRLTASGLPVLRGRLKADARLKGHRLYAFCGIGNPDGFVTTLNELGADVAGFEAFPDHHAYSQETLDRLAARAGNLGARLITTEKDAVRLPRAMQDEVSTVPVEFVLDQPEMLDGLLAPILDRIRTPASAGEPTSTS